MPIDTFLCIAHRGASGYEPENTARAFEHAITLGCSWIELDVYLVEDELVVIHDDILERTTNGTGKVTQRDIAYLRQLDAGDGEKIPFLREVIDLVDHRASINIELKGPGTAAPVVELVHQYVEAGWDATTFLISSFQHGELRTVRHLDPGIKIGALFGRDRANCVARSLELDAYSVNLGLKGMSAELVNEAHDAGLRVLVYTVNHDDEIREMLAMGVDGVFTNYPDRVLTILGNRADGS